MRSLGMPFEQINTEQLVLRYYTFASPIDSIQPAGPSVFLTKGDTQSFAIVTPLPFSHSLNFLWTLDGTTVALTPGFVLNTGNVSAGTHTVSVMVSDPTSMVRNDPGGLLREQGSWNVVVAQPSIATNVTSPSANGTYGVGANIPIRVAFNNTVNVSGGDYALRLTPARPPGRSAYEGPGAFSPPGPSKGRVALSGEDLSPICFMAGVAKIHKAIRQNISNSI
jgi:hypothetical protein